MNAWLTETRTVLRGFRRRPSFAITVVATLIIGLGPTAAIFAFADGYLFRPLPFPDADRIFVVGAEGGALNQADTYALRQSSLGDWGFVEWTVGRRVRGFGILIGSRRVDFYVEGISPGFRRTLAIPLLYGRDFSDDDHRQGDPVPIWLNHRFWMKEFSGDTGVVGQTFSLEDQSQRVVIAGILGPTVSSFNGANEPPAAIAPEIPPATPDARRSSSPFVRLPAGMAPEQASRVIADVLKTAVPGGDSKPRQIKLRSLAERQVAGGRPTATVLFVAALLVLLLATIAVAHLMLVRGMSRASEVATRAALGGSSWRVARVFLIEGLLLGAAGAIGGLLLGVVLARVIQSRIPPFPTAGRNLTLVPMLFDGRVVAFTLIVGLIVSVGAALWPMRRALAQSYALNNRSGTGLTTAISARVSRGILASEIAVATVLIAGAVFIGSGIWRYLHQPLGFEYEDRYWMSISRSDSKPLTASERDTARRAFLSVAGVQAVVWDGASTPGPLEVPDRAIETKTIGVAAVPPGYLETWQMRLREGRWFSSDEFSSLTPVAVVDRKLAETAWPEGSAIGKNIRVAGVLRQVIGVTEPKRKSLRRPPTGQAFLPATSTEDVATAVVWAPRATAGDLQRIASTVVQAVPGTAVSTRPVTLDWLFLRETGEADFQAPIIIIFGLLTLVLAGSSVFGLVSYLVERRVREFGIRLALGARSIDIWRHVSRQSVVPALIGLGIGLTTAMGLEQVVRSSLFGWDSSAPLAVATAGAGLVVISILAAIGPTYRAIRIDPTQTLRIE